MDSTEIPIYLILFLFLFSGANLTNHVKTDGKGLTAGNMSLPDKFVFTLKLSQDNALGWCITIRKAEASPRPRTTVLN